MNKHQVALHVLAALLSPVLSAVVLAQDPSPEDRQDRLPDLDKTPGHATYHSAATVCAIKSTKDERHVPNSVKQEIYESYGVARCQGYCNGPQGCEIDHLISLELGGANTTDNLWPQPYDGQWSAHDKDRLENKLKQMLCTDKTITLKQAQKEIAADWVAAYKKYIGPLKPFKPKVVCQM